MSQADKMFEELGYIKRETNDSVGYIDNIKSFIIFLYDKKSITIHYPNTEYPAIPMEELQAINKKVEELGWVNTRRK